MSYDPKTGRRVYTLDESFRTQKYYLSDEIRQLQQAEYVAALSFSDRLRGTFIWTAVSILLTAGFVLLAIFVPGNWVEADGHPGGGFVAGAVFAGISLLLSFVGTHEKLEEHKGGAAQYVERQKRAVASSQKKLDSIESELIHEQTMDTEKAAAEALRMKTEPSPLELLDVVVATASRDAAMTESDAALWAVVAENPDDEETWQAIADRNGWGPALMEKIRGARGPARRKAASASKEPAIAGWAG